jgi:hypothetical protein
MWRDRPLMVFPSGHLDAAREFIDGKTWLVTTSQERSARPPAAVPGRSQAHDPLHVLSIKQNGGRQRQLAVAMLPFSLE